MKTRTLLIILVTLFLTGCGMNTNITADNQGLINPDQENNLADDMQSELDKIELDESIEDFKNDLNSEIEKAEIENMRDKLENDIQSELDKIEIDEAIDNFKDELNNDIEQAEIENMRDKLENDIQSELDKIEIDEAIDNFKDELNNEMNSEEPQTTNTKTGGSCNLITKSSTCLEYKGTFWTEDQMKANCYEGTFSFSHCKSGNIGGCEIGGGSATDMILYLYPYGGNPIAHSDVQSAKPTCDLNPMGTWVPAT